jgi:hypothetical protein
VSERPTDNRGLGYGVILTLAIVALTLSTGYIHSTLGGLMFTMNALGYAALAVAILVGGMVKMPIVVRFSWAPRLALFGYALVTIIGWAIMGPYYDVAYLAKGIEVTILALLVVDSYRVYGSPVNMLVEAQATVMDLVGRLRK